MRKATIGDEVLVDDSGFFIGDTPIALEAGTALRFHTLWVRQYSESGVGMTVSPPPGARTVTVQKQRIGPRRGLLRRRPNEWGLLLPAHDEDTGGGRKLHHRESFLPLYRLARAIRSRAVVVNVPS